MPKERVLITVKTYPTLSRKYGETVCTAGVREDGSWVGIYPVPFRRLDETEQYRKFDWVECRLIRNQKRPSPRNVSCGRPQGTRARRAHGYSFKLARAQEAAHQHIKDLHPASGFD